jgi:hypothetical protein
LIYIRGIISPGIFGGIILEDVIKYVTMTRFAPERPKAPTSYTVQECDIDKMKARGWVVKEEDKIVSKTNPVDNPVNPSIPVKDEDVPPENEKEEITETGEGSGDKPSANKRGRKPKTVTQEEG